MMDIPSQRHILIIEIILRDIELRSTTYLYRSYPAAKALPLVGARPLSDSFLTCRGIDSAAAAAAAIVIVPVFVVVFVYVRFSTQIGKLGGK